MSDTQVSVTLVPLSSNLAITRNFTLSNNKYFLPIGRSSKRELKGRIPAKDNGWYESRVMSRNHGELVFNPEKQTVYVTDYGSTHGTWLNNVKLVPGVPKPLLGEDIIQFGVDVERGDGANYPALTVRCKIDWIDNDDPLQIIQTPCISETDGARPAPELRPATSTNTFCVPEDDDSDVEEISIDKYAPSKTVEEEPTVTCSHDQASIPFQGEMSTVNQDMNSHKVEATEGSVHETAAVTEQALHDTQEAARAEGGGGDQGKEGEKGEEANREEDSMSDHSISMEEGSNFTDNWAVSSESGIDTYDSNELDASSETSSVVSSNQLSSMDGPNEYIDPSLLAHNDNAVMSTAEHVIKDSEESKPEAIANIKLEALDSKSEISTLTAFRTQFPKPTIPRVLDTSSSRRFEQGALFQPYTAAAQSHLHTRSSEALQNCQNYKDGPFLCNVPLREDNTLNPSVSAPVTSSLKRKVSELWVQDAQPYKSSSFDSQGPGLKPISQSQIAANAISSALSENEPPTKRIKPNYNQPSRLVSYTATAVVSALLGGLGTIALLAALPANYFQ